MSLLKIRPFMHIKSRFYIKPFFRPKLVPHITSPKKSTRPHSWVVASRLVAQVQTHKDILALVIRVRHIRNVPQSALPLSLLRLPLRDHFPRVKLHQHRSVSLELLHRYREPEVVQE